MEMFSPRFTRRMLQPLMALITKVKHLGWYRHFILETDVEEIISGRLDSLKTPETMEGILWQFGTFPSNFKPSLEHLIVHNYQFSYSVNPRQIHGKDGLRRPV